MAGVESATAPPQVVPAPALRVADLLFVAVVFGFFGFAWLSGAANAALIAAEWGYGKGSIQAAATKEIALAASVLLGLFLHALFLVILSICWRLESRRAETREVGGDGGTAAQQPERVQEDQIHGAVIVSLVALFMIIALGVLMQVISSAKGARDERAGYLLLETVFVIESVLFCNVISPLLIIRLVVATRPERRG